MTILYRSLLFILCAVLAGPLFALILNLLIMADMIPTGSLDASFGQSLSIKSAYVWLGSLPFGIASIFAQNKYRVALLLCLLLAPSLFVILYSLSM